MSGLDMSGPEALGKALALVHSKKQCTLQQMSEIWEESGAKDAGLSLLQMLNGLEAHGCMIDIAKGTCCAPGKTGLSLFVGQAAGKVEMEVYPLITPTQIKREILSGSALHFYPRRREVVVHGWKRYRIAADVDAKNLSTEIRAWQRERDSMRTSPSQPASPARLQQLLSGTVTAHQDADYKMIEIQESEEDKRREEQLRKLFEAALSEA